MAKYGQAFSITGAANDTTEDKGISSSEAEKKHLEKIILNVTGHVGNTIQVWFEREKFFEIYDYSIDTAEASGTNAYKSTVKKSEIAIDREIPMGKTINVAIKCGGTAKDLYGTYVFRLV